MSDRKNASSGATTQAPNNPPNQNGGGSTDRSITVNGHRFMLFATCGDNEPRVRDLDLAQWLEYTRPGKIRDLVKGLVRRGLFNGDAVFTLQGKTSETGGRPAKEFWLDRRQALHVIRHCETKVADRFMDKVFDVFDVARAQVQRRSLRGVSGRTKALEAEVQSLRAELHTVALQSAMGARLSSAAGSVVLDRIKRLAELTTGERWPMGRQRGLSPVLRSTRASIEGEIRDAVGWHRKKWQNFPTARTGELIEAIEAVERRVRRTKRDETSGGSSNLPGVR